MLWQRVREAYGTALLRRWPLNWGPVVRIHPLSLKAYVLQTITTLIVNIQKLQVYRLVLTESFRSQQKKLQKYALFINRKAGFITPVAMHLARTQGKWQKFSL